MAPRLSLTATATFDLEAKAADGAPKLPTFAIHGYTGAPMTLDGFHHPVVVDLGSMQPMSQTIPVLRDHDPGRIVGQTDAIDIGADGVRMTGVITGENADAADIRTHARNGFKWQASIGADAPREFREFLAAGKTATVNGLEFTGPKIIA